jgi:hypothetical protein
MKSHMDPKLMLDVLRSHAGYSMGNLEDKMAENRNGSYHIAKAPS